jgi:4-amino-4-deoxy-L-arabinose transferase-like glycosyltransferase
MTYGLKSVVRLTASATRPLPRAALLAICVVYAAFGLFGRDPWKNEDAAGFGVMWTLANGHLHDWLFPNLFGKAMPTDGPLMYWLGALAIRLLPMIDPGSAARIVTALLFSLTCGFVWYATYLLGRRPEVQPFKYVFGGEPLPRDYGRTIADGALLILLACFGLAERGHETTPQLAQFLFVSMSMYGLVRTTDKPLQGACYWGVGLGLLTLSASPMLSLLLAGCSVATVLSSPHFQARHLLRIGVPLAIVTGGAWPVAAHFYDTDYSQGFLSNWIHGNAEFYGGPLSNVLFYALKNLPLFTWPAWPLAIWSWWSWKGLRRSPHIVATLSFVIPMLVLLVLQSKETNRLFILLLPPLSMLAAFGLPTLKRGAINAIDWFAVLSFTVLGGFVWIVWFAGMTGFPGQMARNLARQVPGYTPSFKLLSLITALVVTACWIAIVRWRLATRPEVLWRGVVLSSAGTTLMWVLLMTLWLPFINYSRTYRGVAEQLASHLPKNYTCVTPIRLGNAQIASFGYFEGVRFGFNGENCDVLLRQDTDNYWAPADIRPYVWHLVWEGRRAADRDERFFLYLREEARPAKTGD